MRHFSLLILFVLIPLYGCSSYSVSEQEINIWGNERLYRAPIEIKSQLFNAKLKAERLRVDLEDGRVLVQIQFRGEIKLPFLPAYPGDVNCYISGKPLLDKSSRLLYLSDYEIIKLEVINSRGQVASLKGVGGQFKKRLYEVFPRLPIYSLKKHPGLEGMVLSNVTAIENHQDQLKLVF